MAELMVGNRTGKNASGSGSSLYISDQRYDQLGMVAI